MRYTLFYARNVYASVDDTGWPDGWNKNYEANALTDRDVFRIFRDGATSSNTYRVEPATTQWLRSIRDSRLFLNINNVGNLNANGALTTRLVRPSVTIYLIKKRIVLGHYS